MADIVREIQLGDHTITLKKQGNENYVARLSSGHYGGMLEVEKLEDGKLGLRDLELGSAEISTEHLAMLFVLAGVDDDIIDQIQQVKKIQQDF